MGRLLEQVLRGGGSEHGAVVLLCGEPLPHAYRRAVLINEGAELSKEAKQRTEIAYVFLDEKRELLLEKIGDSDAGDVLVAEGRWMTKRERRYAGTAGVDTVHLLPMRTGYRLIGWLEVGFTPEKPAAPDRIAVLNELADQITVAIELVRMHERAAQVTASADLQDSSHWLRAFRNLLQFSRKARGPRQRLQNVRAWPGTYMTPLRKDSREFS